MEEMAGAMLAHEEFQLIIKQLAIPEPIYHCSFLEELQPPLPFHLKQLCINTFCRCFKVFLVNSGAKWSEALDLLQQVPWLPNLSSK